MEGQMNQWILYGQGFIGSFDLPWSEWSWITDPDPDHLKGMHPKWLWLPLRWLDWIFRGDTLPSLCINYVSMSKDMGKQRAKKVVSDSPGLENFSIGLVNSVFNLPDRQVMFLEEFE